MVLCFFFKKKTAYEMRIRDWSSDVCSSDLGHELHVVRHDDDGRALGPKTVQERHELVGPSPVLPERRFVEPQHPSPGHERRAHREPIGRESCRERVGPYVSLTVVAGTLQKQHKNNRTTTTNKQQKTT